MIDIHNHILPGLDDGSAHIDISEYYIERLIEAHVESVVFTPHFKKGFYENTKEKILISYNNVNDLIKKKGYAIETFCAAEVYLVGSQAVADIQENAFMINGSRYILVENSMNGFTFDFYENLYKLVKLGFKPILAHPERYLEIIKRPELAEDLMHRDIYLQINTGSLLGVMGKEIKNVAWELLDRGCAHFLGSDCHCKSGSYNFSIAVEQIRKEHGNDRAELLTKEFPRKMINNENIPHFYINRNIQPKKKNMLQKMFNL